MAGQGARLALSAAATATRPWVPRLRVVSSAPLPSVPALLARIASPSPLSAFSAASAAAAAVRPRYMSAPGCVAAARRYFSFGVAASFISKDRPYDPTKHVFDLDRSGPDGGSKHAARPESGQDAFFASRVDGSDMVALGVADGVGGWMESGVDPADFSHGLCSYMAAAAKDYRPGQGPPLAARQLMQTGYDAVQRDPSIEAGGSTAIVGLLDPAGTLEVANLGDSGFVHLRLNAVHAASAPQTHAFNTPFQLSAIPPSLLARMATFGGAQLSDMPRDAEVSRHKLRHGDVLVFASDGVWDNLFNQDMLHLVSRVMVGTGAWKTADDGDGGVHAASTSRMEALMHPDEAGTVSLQALVATHITAAAKSASVNTRRDGPFSKEVKRYYPHDPWHGGKVDDICVVVAVVSEDGQADEARPIKSRL